MQVAGTRQPTRGQFDVRDVHKTIIAVSDLTKGAQGAWFDEGGGALVNPKISQRIKEIIEYEYANNHRSRPLRISKRRGIYSFD
eukprot:7761112-Pyramimonas_sp.AAC.1